MSPGGEFQPGTGLAAWRKILGAWLAPDSWPRWLAYAFALASVAVTLLVRLAIGETFHHRPLLIIFVFPVILSAYLGGLGPARVATLAAALAVDYFLIPPLYTFFFSWDNPADLFQWAMLIASGVLVSVLSEALHRSRRQVEAGRLQQAVTLASIGDGVIATDSQGRITFLNPEAQRLTGWPEDEALGQPLPAIFRIVEEQTREPLEDPVQKVLESGTVVGLANHTLLLARDGSELAIAVSGAPIRHPDGTVLGVVQVFHDRTAEQQAEAALRTSEERLRLFIEYAPAALAMFDREMRFLSVSRRWLTDFKLSHREILGQPHYEVFPDIPERWKEAHRRGLAGEVVENEADRFVRADGQVFYLRWAVRPWYDGQGQVAGIVIFSEDITDRQLAEEALRQSLEEKTALLKEVHHRVKNNLQIVSSLLSLQASRSPVPEVVEVLENTKKRVHSMALLHETLYRSDNLARINFAAYVGELCRHLQRSAATGTGRVEVDIRVAPLGLPLEQSLPCGLIINELVSNALKHAFPGGRDGKVTVSLEPDAHGQLVLRVADNGVGPPPAKDLLATPSLGLRLVSGLASQLGGRLTTEQPEGGGAAFQIVFPAPPESLAQGQPS
jgi:PAS domain S-box-containing protein